VSDGPAEEHEAVHMLSCGKSGDSLGEDVCAPSVVVGAAQDVLRAVLPRELWSRVDGGEDELFYVGPDGAVMEVLVEARDGKWSAGAPARLLEGRYFTLSRYGDSPLRRDG
jgi:hypothetical protein